MRRSLALALAFLPAAQAGALDVPLKYERHPDKPAGFVPRGTGMVRVSLEAPPGAWKLPELKGKEPLFGLASLGEGKHLLVLDAAEGKAYGRLFFDADGDGDLSAEQAIEGVEPRKVAGYRMFDFPAVDMKLRLGGKDVPYSFKARFYHPEALTKTTAGERMLHLYMDTNCSWTGQFELEGLGKFRIALGDAGGNGRFDDGCGPGVGPRQNPDFLYMAEGQEITPFDMIHAGRVLVVRGRTFALRIDIAAGRLVLDPVLEGLLPLRLAMSVERMSLTGPQGGAALFQCGGEIGLPAGTYTLLGYQTTRTDEAGGVWRLRGWSGRGGPSAEAGAGSVLCFGEPFTAGVAFSPAVARAGAPSIKPRLSFALAGAGGEQVNGLDLLTPGKAAVELSKKRPTRPSEPAYSVIGPDGEVLGQGVFEYG